MGYYRIDGESTGHSKFTLELREQYKGGERPKEGQVESFQFDWHHILGWKAIKNTYMSCGEYVAQEVQGPNGTDLDGTLAVHAALRRRFGGSGTGLLEGGANMVKQAERMTQALCRAPGNIFFSPARRGDSAHMTQIRAKNSDQIKSNVHANAHGAGALANSKSFNKVLELMTEDEDDKDVEGTAIAMLEIAARNSSIVLKLGMHLAELKKAYDAYCTVCKGPGLDSAARAIDAFTRFFQGWYALSARSPLISHVVKVEPGNRSFLKGLYAMQNGADVKRSISAAMSVILKERKANAT